MLFSRVSDAGSETFAPVNPDGRLTDCLPPSHLSPLGPVAYLHEILLGTSTLGAAVADRRGPLSRADAERAPQPAQGYGSDPRQRR